MRLPISIIHSFYFAFQPQGLASTSLSNPQLEGRLVDCALKFEMSLGFSEADQRVPNPEDLMNLQQNQHRYMMEGLQDSSAPFSGASIKFPYYSHHQVQHQERRRIEYSRSGSARRLWPAASYLGLLVCLAASLLILPLILPPLPPPPLMLLLLLPVGILAMLMVLAFMPSNDTKDITTHTYM